MTNRSVSFQGRKVPTAQGREESAVRVDFGAAQRRELDVASWIEHIPGWLSNPGEVFDVVAKSAGWAQHERWMYNRMVAEPRLTAEFPEISAAPAPLRELAAILSDHLKVPYEGVWINQYRDHNDGTGWHGDSVMPRDDIIVPVLSLGAARHFLIRPVAGGRSISYLVGPGDLIIMGGRAQQDYRHMVPKQKTPAGPRISINFASSTQRKARRTFRRVRTPHGDRTDG